MQKYTRIFLFATLAFVLITTAGCFNKKAATKVQPIKNQPAVEDQAGTGTSSDTGTDTNTGTETGTGTVTDTDTGTNPNTNTNTQNQPAPTNPSDLDALLKEADQAAAGMKEVNSAGDAVQKEGANVK